MITRTQEVVVVVVGMLVGVRWIYALFKISTTEDFVLWEKITYTTLVACIPLYIIAVGLVYDRIQKRKRSSSAGQEQPKDA